MTDFILMVKETSHMFITGPDVIRTVMGEEVEFEELGGAMSHSTKSGVAHFACDDEDQCLEDTRYLLSFLPQNNLESPPRVTPSDDPQRMDAELDQIVPDSPNKPYDMRDVVACIVDDGEFFEVQEHLRQEHHQRVRAPRRYASRRRRQPARRRRPACSTSTPREGGSGSCAPATRSTSRCFTFCDVPGFLPGRRRSGRHHPPRRKLLYAFTEATVPKVTLITRKAYGGAYGRHGLQAHARRLQLRLADAEARGHGARGRGQHHLTARHRRTSRRPTIGGEG
jgi:propionyl-CoA carboxylase beta chain